MVSGVLRRSSASASLAAPGNSSTTPARASPTTLSRVQQARCIQDDSRGDDGDEPHPEHDDVRDVDRPRAVMEWRARVVLQSRSSNLGSES